MTALGLLRSCAGTATVLTLVSACATVTETGRHQILLVDGAQERSLGLGEFEKLKRDTPVAQDRVNGEMLQRVGRRIAAVATLPDPQWEFVLFDQAKTANAFCLPGGKVGVFTGILPLTQDEAGLATVISHEVAHAAARHGAERMSEALMTQLGGAVLGAALGTQSEQARNLWLGAYGLSSEVGWTLPHSRSQELEADHIGLLYMARAGYDPRAAVGFWRRFADYNRQHGNEHWEFLSTHPLDDRRIEQLHSLMPAAMAEYQKRR